MNDKVDALLEKTALARLVNEERRSLHQRVEPELLRVFAQRLESGGADEVLDALRPQFDEAADILGSALATTGGFPDDAAEFLASASAEQLTAYQSVAPAIAALDKVAMIAAAFGPLGPFPVVPDPRRTDAGLRCGWLHDVGTMCCSDNLLEACAAFQRPHPLGDVRTSPWLAVTPHLHTIASATERLRAWAAGAWQAEEAQRPASGRLINGTVVDDPRGPTVHPRRGESVMTGTPQHPSTGPGARPAAADRETVWPPHSAFSVGTGPNFVVI